MDTFEVESTRACERYRDDHGVLRQRVQFPRPFRRRPYSMPVTKIHPESEVRGPRDTGTLMVSGVYARIRGWDR